MIVKKMTNKEPGKSIQATINNLINYIRDEDGTDPERGKILYENTINMTSGQMTTDEIVAEMTELAQTSKRCKNPISHILISFPSGYKASFELCENIVTDFIEHMGYAGCQTAYSVHQNTDNIHIHIAVNRIDPETHKAHSDSFDVERMHQALARLEKKYDLPTENHARYSEIDGEIVKNEYVEADTEITLPSKAIESEIRQGEKSMTRIAAESILPIMQDAQSWPELHTRLANQGFEYRKKGGGSIIVAHHDGKETSIKPSDLARWASLKNMEKRLGTYKPANITQIDDRPAEPMPGISEQDLNNYKADKEQYLENVDEIYREFDREKERLKSKKQAIIDAVTDYKKANKDDSIEAQAALEAYKRVVTEEIARQEKSLIVRLEAKLEENKRISGPVTDFEAWANFNQIEYNQIEHSGRIRIPRYVSTNFKHSIDEKKAFFEQYHEAIQADRYRVTARRNDIRAAFILDADRNGVTIGYTPEQLIKNLPYMSKFEDKYEHIYLTPLSENKHHFFIDDMSFDMVEKLEREGIEPNCLLESSNGNFQAIFTLDKLGTENDKAIINNLASGMNRLYGDVNLCGAIHPHRTPGFYNVKSKYRQPDGTYFITRIIASQPEQSERLKEFMVYMDGYYNWKKANSLKARFIPNPGQNRYNIQYQNRIKLYMAHRKEVMRINNISEDSQDHSRLDYMIGLRLRATRFSQTDVEQILYDGNNHIGYNKHNLEAYCRITSEKIFNNIEADFKIQELRQWIGTWHRINNTALTPSKQSESRNYEPESETDHQLGIESSRSNPQGNGRNARRNARRNMHNLP